jgi:hypothetical protein
MGRKLGLLGHIVRDLERASARAASDARRRAHRAEGAQFRAYEREVVRQERSMERERLRAEHAAERVRIEADKENAKQRKQEAKEAQLAEWRLELAEHQEREQAILGIASESPQVEERRSLCEMLLEPREFQPEPHSPPPTLVPDYQPVHALQQRLMADLEGKCAAFVPRRRGFLIGLAAAGAVGLVGAGTLLIPEAAVVGPWGIGGGLTAALVVFLAMLNSVSHQRVDFRAVLLRRVNSALDVARKQADDMAKDASMRQAAAAQAEHLKQVAAARREFEEYERLRIQSIRNLIAGGLPQIQATLSDLLPLELPVASPCKFTVSSSTAIRVDINLPEPSVLLPKDAKLLASGKVSYKEKTPKRLQEEYRILAAGLAIRHAGEVMFNVPTCEVVTVGGWRDLLDPSRGVISKTLVLEVAYDYPTLAPMAMESVDPVAALRHFRQRLIEGSATPG